MTKTKSNNLFFIFWMTLTAATASGQLVPEGATFTINPDFNQGQKTELVGLVAPENWQIGARFVTPPRQKSTLPEVFDLRPYLPPARNQSSCGSCWAFSTVGAFECVIGVRDGVFVDFSEQYLISCNSETTAPHVLNEGSWGCQGGWFAHDYFVDKPDYCGDAGPVYESDFPYRAWNAPCDCPYPRAPYSLDDWAYVNAEEALPSVEDIKHAIMAYGPVAAAVYVGDMFYLYKDGVFNYDEDVEINHGIVLVGWDDSMGTKGAWIMRNSWGEDWGVDGYMYIEYECCDVGYAANFLEYSGPEQDDGPEITTQPMSRWLSEGEDTTLFINAGGVGDLHYTWYHDGVPVGEDARGYIINDAELTDEGKYQCVVQDLRGETKSQVVFVEVLPAGGVPVSGIGWLVITMLLLASVGVLRILATSRSLR